jgi:hypothetical protein
MSYATDLEDQVQTHIAIGDGGARRVRTDDLMLAKHALYQLSYGPLSVEPLRRAVYLFDPRLPQELVGPGRFELPTLRLSGVRSNQLSYGPPWSSTTALEGGAAQTDSVLGSRSHHQPSG